jgi:hypothetical protein
MGKSKSSEFILWFPLLISFHLCFEGFFCESESMKRFGLFCNSKDYPRITATNGYVTIHHEHKI